MWPYGSLHKGFFWFVLFLVPTPPSFESVTIPFSFWEHCFIFLSFSSASVTAFFQYATATNPFLSLCFHFSTTKKCQPCNALMLPQPICLGGRATSTFQMYSFPCAVVPSHDPYRNQLSLCSFCQPFCRKPRQESLTSSTFLAPVPWWALLRGSTKHTVTVTAVVRELLEKKHPGENCSHCCSEALNQKIHGELANLNATGLSGFRFQLKIPAQPWPQSFILCLYSLWEHKVNCLCVSRTSMVFHLR